MKAAVTLSGNVTAIGLSSWARRDVPASSMVTYSVKRRII